MTDIYPTPRWTVRVAKPYVPNAPPILSDKEIQPGGFRPPKHEIEAFARCILPAIQDYFSSEAGKREFAEWKAQQAAKCKPA